MLRQLGTIATNVAILTALLVYFGWRRTETEAARLGVDESIFGLSTRDYLLRSVGPVLELLAIVAATGLLAVYLDRALRRRAESHKPTDHILRLALFGMSFSWLLLPLLIVGLGYILPAVAFVAFPLAIAAGVLLFVYADHFRHELQHDEPQPIVRWGAERAFVVIALCVTGFWATSNYAEILGNQLADATINHVSELTSVTVYSPQRLAISAPGAEETTIPGASQIYRYRYTGLRLLEHTGGRYFLISDLWKPESGVIIMLQDSLPLRFEFGANAPTNVYSTTQHMWIWRATADPDKATCSRNYRIGAESCPTTPQVINGSTTVNSTHSQPWADTSESRPFAPQ